MPSRRTVLALGASVGGVGAYGTYRHTRSRERQTCTIESQSSLRPVPPKGAFPTYHGGPTYAGFVGSETGPDPGTEHWRAVTGILGDTLSSPQAPVVAGGNVYLTARWRVLALNQSDGTLSWCTEAGKLTATAPTVAEGTVVFGTVLEGGRGGVAAFDAADGTRLWRAPDKGFLSRTVGRPTMAPTVHDGTVYVGGQQTPKVTALDLESGAISWQTDVEGTGVSSPAVADDRAFVQCDGALVSLDARDGSVDWRTDAGEPISPPTLVDDTLFGTATETAVSAWDATTGQQLWTDTGTQTVPESIAADGTDVVVSTNDALHVLNADSGRARWRKSVEELRPELGTEDDQPSRLYECLLSEESLYLAVDSGFAVLDRDDGSVRWDTTFPAVDGGDFSVSGTPFSPAITDGFAYLYTKAGQVFVLGL